MNAATDKLKKFKEDWLKYLSAGSRRNSFWAAISFLTIILVILPNFLQFVETRRGVVLDDPVLNLFEPVNVTWLTFILIYSSLFIAVINFLGKPRLFHTAVASYSIIAIFRIFAMYVIPLNPPEKIILLNDPFVQLFGTGEILTKDLFFSGHTSTLFMLYLVMEQKVYKKFFLASTILVAFGVLVQHVHYTIDVLAAPFFAYTAYKIACRFVEKICLDS